MPAASESDPGGDSGAAEGDGPGGEAAAEVGETAPKGADRQVRAEEEENQQALLVKKEISYKGLFLTNYGIFLIRPFNRRGSGFVTKVMNLNNCGSAAD